MLSRFRGLERRSLALRIGLCFGLLAGIGAIDYLTGFEMYFSVFYLLEVALAAWFVGRMFGLTMSVLSVLVWVAGDLAAGAHYSRPWILAWNAVILTVFYFVVVALLCHLREAQRDLEMRVQQRTAALTREIAERERLEAEILKVSEREQRRIGHELHDGLCQHLTATALAGQVLSGKLAAKGLTESEDANQVVELVEEGIDLARNLARGLYPVEMEAEGLMAAFQELAATLTRSRGVSCVFECDTPVLVHDDAAASQLFSIGREAVRNAVKHGEPGRIGISLSERNGIITLTIEDDGSGLPDNWQETSGLGLRIMAHRAASIGGACVVGPGPTGGTIVNCTLPLRRAPEQTELKPA